MCVMIYRCYGCTFNSLIIIIQLFPWTTFHLLYTSEQKWCPEIIFIQYLLIMCPQVCLKHQNIMCMILKNPLNMVNVFIWQSWEKSSTIQVIGLVRCNKCIESFIFYFIYIYKILNIIFCFKWQWLFSISFAHVLYDFLPPCQGEFCFTLQTHPHNTTHKHL